MDDITTRVRKARESHPGDIDAQAQQLQDQDEIDFPEFYGGMATMDYAEARCEGLSQWLYWIQSVAA